ncbi:hypothetical protein GA0061098_103423 [Bradyrhizobium shewense]|uniref:Uncharacterized protein n=1 Tax=Bradyrhizobium shewense TaxID=1761772 RepID=A0A1C3XS08_9BRAD|nr:hypothetical protein GA0061098_103423 [Bradyrhizobium shewense]
MGAYHCCCRAGIAGLLTAISQIVTFFGIAGEKQVNIDIESFVTVLNSSYEEEGDVVVARSHSLNGAENGGQLPIRHPCGRPAFDY